MPLNEIQCLYDIAAIPIEITEVAAVFPHMIQYAQKLFAIEASVLYVEDAGRLVLHAEKGMQDISLPQYLPDPDDTLRNRQTNERPFPHELPAAGLVLRVGRDRMGWLYLARSQDFSDVEARLLAVFAERIGIALHHARTQESIRQERSQRKLAHTLHDISLILTSRRSFEQILEQILVQVARVLPYDAASVWLIGDDAAVHRIYGVGNEKFERNQQQDAILSPQADPILHEMMTYKRVIIISDAHADKRWILKQQQSWIKSSASAPILIGGDYVGQFTVNHSERNFYGDTHIPLLESLTQLISIAAQNAHVYDEMRQALVQEKELNDLKTRFISTVSHEFRTPLATILTYSQLLERYDTRLEAKKKRDYFDKIKGQIQYMTSLVEDVLIIGKSDAVGLELKPNMNGLAEFCEDIVGETRLFAPSNLKFVFDVKGDGTDPFFDSKLMRHILFNLLSNAVKYSPDGGTIRFGLEYNHKVIKLVVSDEGIGIPEEEQQNLFTSFFRASNVDSLPGTGLGLAVVKRAVDAYGGKIDIKSRANMGTAFTILLPIMPAAAAR